MSDWCTIESDPGVFTSLIEEFGCRNAQLTELWSLDDDSLSELVHSYGKVYGLIFLFKWVGGDDHDNSDNDLDKEDVPESIFFAKQVTTNACATQAILSILLNVPETQNDEQGLILGDTLSSLKSFVSSFPPDLRGEAIAASDEIRTAHNSFARKESFLMDDSKKRFATKDDDVFHFIAYVPHEDGNVYALDGLAPSPLKVGCINTVASCDDLAWLSAARQAIQKRIEKYSATEIKFNLMALTKDRRVDLRSKIHNLVESGLSEDDELITGLKMELGIEDDLRKTWKDENERRQHNYLPFCMELIRGLAMSGKLQDAVKKANAREGNRSYHN